MACEQGIVRSRRQLVPNIDGKKSSHSREQRRLIMTQWFMEKYFQNPDVTYYSMRVFLKCTDRTLHQLERSTGIYLSQVNKKRLTAATVRRSGK